MSNGFRINENGEISFITRYAVPINWYFKNNDYEEFGDEWIKEMLKFKKLELVMMVRAHLIANKHSDKLIK